MPGHTPLDHRALADVVAPFGASRTLPAEAYTSSEVGHVYRGDGLVVPTAPDRTGSAYSQSPGSS